MISLLRERQQMRSKQVKQQQQGSRFSVQILAFIMAGASNLNEDMLMFGYACKLFRDNDKALFLDEGRHLISWMGDGQHTIGRYDTIEEPPYPICPCMNPQAKEDSIPTKGCPPKRSEKSKCARKKGNSKTAESKCQTVKSMDLFQVPFPA